MGSLRAFQRPQGFPGYNYPWTTPTNSFYIHTVLVGAAKVSSCFEPIFPLINNAREFKFPCILANI